MDLFRELIEHPDNRLPRDGEVKYYGVTVPISEADAYFKRLFDTIAWQHDEVLIHGKRIVTKRKVAWHGDKPFDYSYSNTSKRALPWSPLLLELKALVEKRSGEQFNACLLNLYHDGSEGMTWHSDDEIDLKKGGAIASLSFGAERKFAFKHKATKKTVALVLEHGSLLIMAGVTQRYWQHRLPPTIKVTQPRISLTFRTMVQS